MQADVHLFLRDHTGGVLLLDQIPKAVGADKDRCLQQAARWHQFIHGGVDLERQAVTGGQIARGPEHFITRVTETVGQAAPLPVAVEGGIVKAIEGNAVGHPQHQHRIFHRAHRRYIAEVDDIHQIVTGGHYGLPGLQTHFQRQWLGHRYGIVQRLQRAGIVAQGGAGNQASRFFRQR